MKCPHKAIHLEMKGVLRLGRCYILRQPVYAFRNDQTFSCLPLSSAGWQQVNNTL